MFMAENGSTCIKKKLDTWMKSQENWLKKIDENGAGTSCKWTNRGSALLILFGRICLRYIWVGINNRVGGGTGLLAGERLGELNIISRSVCSNSINLDCQTP